MANIRVTPETLEAQGEDLINYAEALREILKDVDNKVTEIDGEWDGLAQDGYLGMYQNLKKTLDEFPELVDSLGTATKDAAKAFSELDSDLQKQFQ